MLQLLNMENRHGDMLFSPQNLHYEISYIILFFLLYFQNNKPLVYSEHCKQTSQTKD